jgi:hypothetical protein
MKRMKMLQCFDKVLIGIQQNMIADGGRVMTADEKEVLQSFRQPEHPFSLMFTVRLEGLRL